MINKPRKTTTPTLKRTLGEIRKSYTDSGVAGTKDKDWIKLEFSRIGTHYRIENAPVPPTDKIGIKLEKSFNELMKNLKADYKGAKLEGKAFIAANLNEFIIEYSNLENKGGDILRDSKVIHGKFDMSSS